MQIQERLYPNAICGTTPDILGSIQQEENSIAIFQRELTGLGSGLSIAIEKDFSFQTSGTMDELGQELARFFNENLSQCDALRQDIMDLVHLFDEVVRDGAYKLLFSTVSSNMCRKFHTDINDLRLLCTYAGKGTLWVAEDEMIRTDHDELSIDDDRVHQAAAGDVLILKGALHENGNPIMHRSPSIEESGGKRLLLRLDTNNMLGS